MRGLAAIGAGALAAVVLAAQVAPADPVSPTAGPALTYKQVLHIALGEARSSNDPHPRRIEMASGSLRDAMSVMDPTGGSGTAGDGQETVDLVAMHGHFRIDAPHPRGRQIGPGKVIELVIGAHTGFVQGRSQSDSVEVPLSHLGPVTRLR